MFFGHKIAISFLIKFPAKTPFETSLDELNRLDLVIINGLYQRYNSISLPSKPMRCRVKTPTIPVRLIVVIKSCIT